MFNEQPGETSGHGLGWIWQIIIIFVLFMLVAQWVVPLFNIAGRDLTISDALAYLGGQGYAVYADPSGTFYTNDILPNADSSYDVGATGSEYAEGHFDAVYAPTGRTATLVVAASDASALSKAQADYVVVGTADDEINAAIAALPPPGGIIHLTEGLFSISASINLNRTAVLEGSGMGYSSPSYAGTRISLANGANVPMIVLDATGLEQIICAEVRSLCLNGNKANQGVATPSLWLKNNLADCLFTDLFFVSCKGNPIEISDGWLHRFTRIWAENYDGIGVHIQETGAFWSGSLSFTDSRISGGVNAVKIEDGCGAGGAADPWDSCFTGCIFSGAQQHGVILDSAPGWTFNGCTFRAASQSVANTYDDINIDDDGFDPTVNVAISGSIIDGVSQSRYGVTIDGLSNYICVMGNVIVNHATGTVNVVGAANANGRI
ncbi:MAG: hypothetical protein MUO97_05925, partial [Dehalococcoidia bacterium]|nr:hypothetical protein [Dehalococcoidia bacterium]